MIEMNSRVSLQSLPDSEVFSPCSIEHQDVFMYEDEGHVRPCVTEGRDSPTFLDISNSKSSHFPQIKPEPDTDTLMSWTQKHPEHWSQNEILDWIYFVASTIDVDPTTIRGEGFQNITGPELCRMTLEDFQKRDPVNGKCFYDMFRSLHKDAFFYSPVDIDMSPPSIPCYESDVKQEQKQSSCPYSASLKAPEDNFITYAQGNELRVLLGEEWYDIDTCVEVTDDIEKIARQIYSNRSEIGYGSSDSESVSDASEMDCSRNYRKDSVDSEVFSEDELSQLTLSVSDNTLSSSKKKQGTKRSKNGDQQKPQNRGRKPGQISKGNHLWEFIRDLLKDPKFNPHLLRWEEKETGVFRFVQSEAVAQMWGRKKNNPGMTYEKLSRAMRFCRTAGYFAEVPKTGKFPKKLCFRFGAKAFGWKE